MSSNRSGLSIEQKELVHDTLSCYARGWFPMHDSDTGVVHWVQPRRRGVIPLDGGFRVSRSLRAAVRSGRFEVTCDQAFGAVIRECAKPATKRETTWLDESITGLFELLHMAGHAHSVEAWRDGPGGRVLVGGLYGLVVGSAFCGESMFSAPSRGGTDASKVCLVHLVEHLRRQGFMLLDAQLLNQHLRQFGCFEVEQHDYAERMFAAASVAREWGMFRGGTRDGRAVPAGPATALGPKA